MRKARGYVLSIALHVALLLVILAGADHPGPSVDEARPQLLSLPEVSEPRRSDGDELPRHEPSPPKPPTEEELNAVIARLASIPAAFAPPPDLPIEEAEQNSITVTETRATFAMLDAEKADLARRLERLAEESLKTSRTEATWQQDGKHYHAVMTREAANDGTALERVIAEVSTADRGKHLTTLVNLRRLAFSQFTQIVDFWNPNVQLHDDEIVGRFHSNSTINLLYDRRAGPKFFGKVTTTARSFNTDLQVRKRDADKFRGAMETGAGKIELPEAPQPFKWAPRDAQAQVHEFSTDTRIQFYGDGSYTWQARDGSEPARVGRLSDQPAYFIAEGNVELFVQGVVAGKVLIYSPLRIVIEGSLTYATDPRDDAGSRDYTGLVSNRFVEVAPPGVTGHGDLEIDAAIFAGRRFVVTNIDHRRKATLRIYGSLAAGSLTATEPRYATRIEYDGRFERQRPPGFPSTNRYEAVDWEGKWTELPK
jgi:hypothetical protein